MLDKRESLRDRIHENIAVLEAIASIKLSDMCDHDDLIFEAERNLDEADDTLIRDWYSYWIEGGRAYDNTTGRC